jgi:hypothetical protein
MIFLGPENSVVNVRGAVRVKIEVVFKERGEIDAEGR